MGFFGKDTSTESAGIDRRRSLAGVPVINENVSISRTQTDTWQLSVGQQRKRIFLRRKKTVTVEKQFKLDEIGTFVVGCIDGSRTVLDIIEALSRKYSINRREAELSVAEFMKMLSQRGVVSILIK